MSNEKLGTWICPMGGTADVYQTKKRGRHFYTRCDCCGLNQGTGAGRQQKIFDEAVFTLGVECVTPSNVDGNQSVVSEQPKHAHKADTGQHLEQHSEPTLSDDFNPLTDQPEADSTEVQSERKGLKIGLALLAMGASVGAGLWMS